MGDQIIVAGAPLTYNQYPWGDLITGTKQQLQALGLAVGRAFPGELGGGGPLSKLKTQDRYGCTVVINKAVHSGCELYDARRTFPAWPENPTLRTVTETIGRGVQRRRAPWWDDYVGTPSDLIALGLISPEHVSKRSELAKKTLTVYADGSIETNRVPSKYKLKGGARKIRETTGGKLVVQIYIPDEEGRARFKADCEARDQWERMVRTLPRPPRLTPLHDRASKQFDTACAAAARDLRFQGMLARLAHGADGGDGVR
jgi:hypothetical protein